jgi:hypothetical protein
MGNAGAVLAMNFKVADNKLAGIEFEFTSSCEDGTCGVDGATVVGMSSNGSSLSGLSPRGVITAASENMRV